MKKLKNLFFKKNKIIDEIIYKIKSGAFKNSKLDLSGKDLTNSDLLPLWESLQGNVEISELDLSNNLIGDIEFINNIKVIKLNLSDNKIIQSRNSLVNNEIQYLNLNGNLITDIDFKGIKNLKSLEIKRNKISDISRLELNENLIMLDLSENHISSLSALPKLKNLNTLIVSDNSLSDLNFLRKHKNIENLVVKNNKIVMLDALSAHEKLKFIDLDNNYVENLLPLAFNKSIDTICLKNNPIKKINPLVFNYTLRDLFANNIKNEKLLKIILARNQEISTSPIDDRNEIISKYNHSIQDDIIPFSLYTLAFFSKSIQDMELSRIPSHLQSPASLMH
ncbi:TPA: leucine-rich repeat domain-containing protein [Legionella pneumophila]|nr:leucine-rich repeat domain-containing protein [Legionella pneumophila]MCK1859328.1 leucine-rich repeat domain-containing protein [Legionella pneumophila]HDV5711237.1 leucine-rich repeat domain-containing protein [Legionella pneumophila]HDV5713834.1 leucine-rich repeat domain-containing protein [Legionella pneumophila]HDV5807124.1 leucine-rich repeat domain-containing protein [Legionella pneumophila]HDV5941541.1 leucine-rich repeat domain-containing protein [Legionella pneumophila]